jgi:hypothetical protein
MPWVTLQPLGFQQVAELIHVPGITFVGTIPVEVQPTVFSWVRKVVGEMFADEALPWARLGCELVRPGAPDDPFRNALVEKSRKLR